MAKKKTLLLTFLSLAVPNILQQFITNLSGLIDNIMVGGLDEYAIAGVTINNSIFFIFMIALFGVSASAGIFIPQFMGINEEEKVSEVFKISLFFSILTGLLFFLIMTFFPQAIFNLYAQDAGVFYEAFNFLRPIRWTFLFFPITTAIIGGFRFTGNVKIPLFITLFTVAIGIFLNFGLIHGNLGMPALGVTGAAIATLITRIIELILAIAFTFIIKSPIQVKLSKMFAFNKNLLKSYIEKGYVLVINELFWVISTQAIIVIYTARISTYIAAMSISSAVTNMMFVGIGGVGVAISIILGESLGRSEFDTAKQQSRKLLMFGSLTGLTFGIIMFILSFPLLTFYNVDVQTLAFARQIITIGVAFSWIYYLNASFFFTLRSGGDTKSVLFMDSIFNWVVMVPFAILVGWLRGAQILAISLPLHFLLVQLTEFLKTTTAVIRYKKGVWLENLTENT